MDDNVAHSFMSRDEFDAFLEGSPQWQIIKEEMFSRAFDDLRMGEFANGGGVLLTTTLGIRGQDANTLRIFYLNFLIKDSNDDAGNSGEG
jgi:hypothetical protein